MRNFYDAISSGSPHNLTWAREGKKTSCLRAFKVFTIVKIHTVVSGL